MAEPEINSFLTHLAVKEQLILFLNVVIENPSFDSQTKNYLNTPSSRFGSKCEVSEKFIEYIAKKLGVMDAAINLTQVKANNVPPPRRSGRARGWGCRSTGDFSTVFG